MASTKITVDQYAKYLKRLAEDFKPTLVRGLQAGVARLIPELQKRTMNAKPASKNGKTGAVDTGLYKAGWRTEPMPDGGKVLNIQPYAATIERGRRPGPVDRIGIRNLERWARRRLRLSKVEAERAAHAIANSMKKKSLKARRVLTGDIPGFIEIVEEEILHELDLELKK